MKTKKHFFLVKSNNNYFATTLTRPGSWTITFFYFTTTFTTMWIWQKNVCISPLRELRCNNEKKFYFSVWLLLSLHHDQERNIYFHFVATLTTAKIKFGHYICYTVITEKIHFIFIAPLPWLRCDHEKKMFLFFISLRHSLGKYLLTSTYCTHTSLTCRESLLPGKACYAKLSFSGISGESYMLTTQKNIL